MADTRKSMISTSKLIFQGGPLIAIICVTALVAVNDPESALGVFLMLSPLVILNGLFGIRAKTLRQQTAALLLAISIMALGVVAIKIWGQRVEQKGCTGTSSTARGVAF